MSYMVSCVLLVARFGMAFGMNHLALTQVKSLKKKIIWLIWMNIDSRLSDLNSMHSGNGIKDDWANILNNQGHIDKFIMDFENAFLFSPHALMKSKLFSYENNKIDRCFSGQYTSLDSYIYLREVSNMNTL